MKPTAKAAVVRVIHDLILADGILDTREMELLSTLYAEYGAKPVDVLSADECTLAEALSIFVRSRSGASPQIAHRLFAPVDV